MRKHEDWCPCTKDKPLYLDLELIGQLFLVADEAAKLLNAILDQKPIAKWARELAAHLSELDGHMIGGGGEESYWPHAEAYLEIEFNHFRVRREGSKVRGIILWSDKESDVEEPDPQ